MKLEIFIPWQGPTLNQIWAGTFWNKRRKIAQAGHWAVKAALNGHTQMLQPPIQIEFTPIHGKGNRRLDCSNYAVTAKVLEDGLVHCNIIPGDSFYQVTGITINQPVKGDETGMWVILREVDHEN